MKPVESNIIIHQPISIIKDAFLNLEHLSKWWKVEKSYIEPKVGGTYCLVWGITKKGFSYVSSGVITHLSDSTLEIDNMVYLNFEKPILGGMKVVYTFQKVEEGTLLHIKQTGYKEGSDWEWYRSAVEAGWPEALKILKRYLEDGIQPE